MCAAITAKKLSLLGVAKTGLENITARIIAATVIQCTEIITRRKVTGTVSNYGETPLLMPLPNKVGLAAIKTTIQLGLFILSRDVPDNGNPCSLEFLSYTGFHFSYFLSLFLAQYSRLN